MNNSMRPIAGILAIALVSAGPLLAQSTAPAAIGPSTRKVAQMPDSRVLLEGETLQIGFHGTGKAPYPEDIVPPAVLRAIAQYLKVDLKTQGIFWGDYCYFAGTTGEAFRFMEFMGLAKTDPGEPLVQRYGNMTTLELYQHALDAAGLESAAYMKPASKADLQRLVVESLGGRKTPVIGLGVFGPPEPFLITGYDDDGEVLLGWSHLQGEKKNDPNISFEPTGQFRLRNWYQALDGIVIITGTKNRPSPREIYRSSLERAIRELRTTRGTVVVGTAAMEQWASHLENEADYAGFSEAQWKKAQSDHGTTAGDLAERRALAASFMELATRVFPEAQDDLAGAQGAFQGMHDTVYEIWETVARSGPFDPDLAKFKDPARRKTMAGLVRRIAELDRRGLAHLQRALQIIDGKDAGPAAAEDLILDGTVRLQKADLAPSTHPPIWAPENIHVANSLSMLQAFLGEPFGALNDAEKSSPKLQYALWMGYSGAAFGLLGDGPESANLPLAFDALGYDYELWMSGQLAQQTALPCHVWGWDDNLRRRIFWNLRDRHLPVLLFNWGKWPDWWLLTQAEHWRVFRGYGGNSGEGYRPSDPLDDPKNPLRQIDLFDGMKGDQTWTINVTAKRLTPKPSMEELYRRAITWGAKKLSKPKMTLLDAQGAEFISTHPYQDWAEMMRTDALFPADDLDTLKQRRQWLEGREVELAERRFYGATFLELASGRLARGDLKEAAAHFRAIHELMTQIWAQTGGLGVDDGYLKYAEAATREKIADLLLQIGREDAAAAAILSR